MKGWFQQTWLRFIDEVTHMKGSDQRSAAAFTHKHNATQSEPLVELYTSASTPQTKP